MILAILAVAAVAAVAKPSTDRYLTIKEPTFEDIYDLETVHEVQPGRFTIKTRNMHSPDVIRIELAASGHAGVYCEKSPGEYDADQSLLIFGQPDMPVEKVKVAVYGVQKLITWNFPYKRTTLDPEHGTETYFSFFCRNLQKDNVEDYVQWENLITNGLVTVAVFDCERGLSGTLMHSSDDPDTAIMSVPHPGSIGESAYFKVCYTVNHKPPYAPNGN